MTQLKAICWNKEKGSNMKLHADFISAGTKRKEVTQNKHSLEQNERK
jgi:hypothetical protein